MMTEAASVDRAKVFLADRARRHRSDTPSESDAGQIAATETFASNALTELQTKNKALVETGNYTPSGIKETLQPEIDAYEQRAIELRDTVIMPRAKAAERTLQDACLPEISDREFTQHHQILERFAALPSDRRQLALAHALSGKEPALARALAHEPRFTSTISTEVHGQLRDRFLSDETKTELTTAHDILQRTEAALNTLQRTGAAMRQM